MIVADTLSRRPDHLPVSLNVISARPSSSFLDELRKSYDKDDDFGALFKTASTNLDLLRKSTPLQMASYFLTIAFVFHVYLHYAISCFLRVTTFPSKDTLDFRLPTTALILNFIGLPFMLIVNNFVQLAILANVTKSQLKSQMGFSSLYPSH